MAALAVQTGCSNITGSIVSRRRKEDKVTGKSLIFFHKDDISNLRQTQGGILGSFMSVLSQCVSAYINNLEEFALYSNLFQAAV